MVHGVLQSLSRLVNNKNEQIGNKYEAELKKSETKAKISLDFPKTK